MAIVAVAVLAPAIVDAQDGSGSVSVSVPNLAPYVSPYIGPEATGGTVASCPAGQIVVGVAGTRLTYIKALTPLCGTLSKTGAFIVVAPLNPAAVATGSRGFRLQCRPARTVTRVRVSYNRADPAQQYLGGVEIGCSSWLLSQWSGTPQPSATTDFDAWAVKPAVACNNQTQPIRALQIRATSSVKALSIICDELF
jgi:hypothetical protein